MAWSPFVQPDVVRLHLVDVYTRAHAALEVQLKSTKDRKALAKLKADLAHAVADIADAKKKGLWIDVKKELTAGEQRGVFGRLVKDLHFGEKASLIPEQVGLSKIMAYLVGWSFPDVEGKPVPLSEDAVNNLDASTYGEIVSAIDHHEETIETARQARKNARSTERASSGISASPDV